MTSYPKPDGQRVTRHRQQFAWADLPAAGRQGQPPSLPPWRSWHQSTRIWWQDVWSTPQATMWDATGRSMWTLAALHDDLFSGVARAAQVSGEIRQHEDRHGLSPKAMLQLR